MIIIQPLSFSKRFELLEIHDKTTIHTTRIERLKLVKPCIHTFPHTLERNERERTHGGIHNSIKSRFNLSIYLVMRFVNVCERVNENALAEPVVTLVMWIEPLWMHLNAKSFACWSFPLRISNVVLICESALSVSLSFCLFCALPNAWN